MFRFLCQGWKISIIHWGMHDKQTESVHNSTSKISSLHVTFFCRTIHNVRFNSVPSHHRRGRGRGASRDVDPIIASADFVIVAKKEKEAEVRWKLRALGGAQFWHSPIGDEDHQLMDLH